MKFPRKIHVYGNEVQVKLVARKTLGADRLGDFHDSTIRIWRGLKGSSKWSVLLHECLHLAWEYSNGDEMSDELEEKLVLRMELPLYEILSQNFDFGLD